MIILFRFKINVGTARKVTQGDYLEYPPGFKEQLRMCLISERLQNGDINVVDCPSPPPSFHRLFN